MKRLTCISKKPKMKRKLSSISVFWKEDTFENMLK